MEILIEAIKIVRNDYGNSLKLDVAEVRRNSSVTFFSHFS